MQNLYLELHAVINQLPKYDYTFNPNDVNLPKNGIYFQFEKGETVNGMPRIVRCGTHGLKDNNNELVSRIANQHYKGDGFNSRGNYALGGRSVFRKNIGLAMLQSPELYLANTLSDSQYAEYQKIWKLSQIEKSKIIKSLAGNETSQDYWKFIAERNIQAAITKRINSEFTFSIIEVNTPQERALYEALIIGTLSGKDRVAPSANWLGRISPKSEVRTSGLWQSEGTFGIGFNEAQFATFVKLFLTK